MKKIFVVFALIICSCATTPKNLSFDNALETGIKRIGNDLPEGTKVAILDFKSNSENLSAYIIEEMYDKLVNYRKLTIMERSRTQTIAMEVGYQLSGEVDDNQVINIGKQLGADYVVTGQIAYSGEAYRLRVFAIDIEKGSRVASSSSNINRNDRQITYLLGEQAQAASNANQHPLMGEWRSLMGDDFTLSFEPQNKYIGYENGRVVITGRYDDKYIYGALGLSQNEGATYRIVADKLYILDELGGDEWVDEYILQKVK